MVGNAFAYLVLVLWVPVSLLAFTFFRPQVAAVIVILGGTMFLALIFGLGAILAAFIYVRLLLPNPLAVASSAHRVL